VGLWITKRCPRETLIALALPREPVSPALIQVSRTLRGCQRNRSADCLLFFREHVVQNALHSHDMSASVVRLVEMAGAGKRSVLHSHCMFVMAAMKSNSERAKPDAFRLFSIPASFLHLANQR